MLPMFSVLIILFTFLGVTQYFIGFVDFLKFILLGIQIRVIFPGQLTKSLFDIILRSTFVYSKNLVIIYIGHVL